MFINNRSQVPRFRFASDGIFGRFQRSAPPLATEVASLIKKVTLVLRSHIRGLETGPKLKTRSPRKKCWFCHIIAKYHVPDPPASPVMYRTGISQEVCNGGQVCGGGEAVGFPVQNVYKITYGDENATFEPVNGYKNRNGERLKRGNSTNFGNRFLCAAKGIEQY
ncbi:MAG: hypothetical protein B1H12_08055 [Desulfobacteraceae bacterium 4484_190.2]|nr:MAG: hypothetical protein B1H12_08055 [Desulfobacteraceae bacterium 4484_190.2]